MLYKGVFKRVLPFAAAFAAGLFIASFFVSIASPSFSFSRKANKCREMRQLRSELDRVTRENSELRRQVEGLQNSKMTVVGDTDFSSFELDAPPPPPPPRAPRHPRFDR